MARPEKTDHNPSLSIYLNLQRKLNKMCMNSSKNTFIYSLENYLVGSNFTRGKLFKFVFKFVPETIEKCYCSFLLFFSAQFRKIPAQQTLTRALALCLSARPGGALARLGRQPISQPLAPPRSWASIKMDGRASFSAQQKRGAATLADGYLSLRLLS